MNTQLHGHLEVERAYLASLTPPAARDLFFVSRYDLKDPNSNAHDHHGYQRPPTEKRFDEIAKYFTAGDNRYMITPLIVAVRLKDPEMIERFLRFFAAGDIAGIKRVFGDFVASVVDGQHRLFGLIRAWENDSDFLPSIPVVFYFGLSFIEEATLFNTINATQRKLPKALIETTRGDITEQGSLEYHQRIRRIAFALCRDGDSVWGPVNGTEQVNMTGVRDPDRPVTYEGLRRSTANMFPTELLERLEGLDETLPVTLAKRYWRLVSEACHEAWVGEPSTRTEVDELTGEVRNVPIKYRIKDLVGVAALAKLGKDIIASQIEMGHRSSRMQDLVDRLADVDWEKREDNDWMRSQAGFAGQKELYLLLYQHVYDTDNNDEVEPVFAGVTGREEA
jgi:DGQHR domain-containing protein